MLSDERPPQSVVQTLDEYFDWVAGAVMAAGGEVLKFVGDAILAIFPVAVATAEADDTRAFVAARSTPPSRAGGAATLNEERVARRR